MRCVLVDDEPLAIEILETYLAQVKGAIVSARFYDPVEAFSYLQQNRADVLFLDLNMPMLSGIDLLKSLSHKPAVIMTTAYREYAADGFELDVIDYLVKPIAFPRFLKAVNKAMKQSQSMHDQSYGDAKQDNDQTLWLKVDKKLVPVMTKDILYVQSLKDYVKVVTHQQKLVTYHTLQALLEKLPPTDFVRVHKSYAVQVSRINSIEGNMIHINNETLPVGRSFKIDLLTLIDRMGGD